MGGHHHSHHHSHHRHHGPLRQAWATMSTKFFTPAPEKMYTPMEKVRLKKRKMARFFFREILGYGAFMVVFCLVSYNIRTGWSFYMNDAAANTLINDNWYKGKTFQQIVNIDDVWSFWFHLLDNLMPTSWYNDDDVIPYDRNFTLLYNYMVGRVRLRQLRVQKGVGTGNSVCFVSKKFTHAINFCYPPYSSSVESTASYGPYNDSTVEVASAFVWHSAKELCSRMQWCPDQVLGQREEAYPASGFVWDLDRNHDPAYEQLQALKDNVWIDKQTRAVLLEFTIYNPNIRMLVPLLTVIEFYPSGGIVVKSTNKPVRILKLETGEDIVLFLGELFLAAVVAFYFFRELVEFSRFYRTKATQCPVCLKDMAVREGNEKQLPCCECERLFNQFRLPHCPRCGREVPDDHMCWKGYFQDPWNFLDLTNYGCFAAMFYLRFDLRRKMDITDYTPGDKYAAYWPLAEQYNTANSLNSVITLFCFLKCLKYLGRFRSLSTPVRTLFIAYFELSIFCSIFMIVFAGYGLAYHFAFGVNMYYFKDWGLSLLNLFSQLFGVFDYPSIQNSNRVLGPLFFMTFEITCFYILANMFIAIVNRAFGDARRAVAIERDDFMSSSIKMYINEWKLLIAKLGIIDHNSELAQIRRLLDRFDQATDLTLSQQDDVRTFRNEVENDVGNRDLFNYVLKRFYFNVDRVVGSSDFMRLKEAVSEYREFQRKMKIRPRVWDDQDEFDEVLDDPETYISAVDPELDAANPDPSLDESEILGTMCQTIENGGVLRTHWRLLRRYTNVFTGAEAVDWVHERIYHLERSRSDAIRLLSFWASKGYLAHIWFEHPFEDDHSLLYRFHLNRLDEDRQRRKIGEATSRVINTSRRLSLSGREYSLSPGRQNSISPRPSPHAPPLSDTKRMTLAAGELSSRLNQSVRFGKGATQQRVENMQQKMATVLFSLREISSKLDHQEEQERMRDALPNRLAFEDTTEEKD